MCFLVLIFCLNFGEVKEKTVFSKEDFPLCKFAFCFECGVVPINSRNKILTRVDI